MSNILTAQLTYLRTISALTALVSTRIYPQTIPAGTSANPTPMPCLTFQMVDEPVITTHNNEQLFTARLQFDAWGGSYTSAHAVANALFTALHGYKGSMGTVPVGSVFRLIKRDDSDPDVALNRVIQDFIFNYA